MEKLKNFYKAWQPVVSRVAKEASLPLVIAAIWGVTVMTQKGIIDGISAAGIAFFFILALQGQILRVAKNVRDESNAKMWTDSLTNVKAIPEKLQK